MITPQLRFLLEDVRLYARESIDTVGGRTADEVLSDRLREHAVLRTTQIVGEAAAQILKQRPAGFEGIELREAVALRNMLVHGYAKIRMTAVIDIVANDLPRLVAAIDRLLTEGQST